MYIWDYYKIRVYCWQFVIYFFFWVLIWCCFHLLSLFVVFQFRVNVLILFPSRTGTLASPEFISVTLEPTYFRVHIRYTAIVNLELYSFHDITYLLRTDNHCIKVRPLVHQGLELEWVSLVHVEDSPINLSISTHWKVSSLHGNSKSLDFVTRMKLISTKLVCVSHTISSPILM